MITIYTGPAGSGKTTRMIEDIGDKSIGYFPFHGNYNTKDLDIITDGDVLVLEEVNPMVLREFLEFSVAADKYDFQGKDIYITTNSRIDLTPFQGNVFIRIVKCEIVKDNPVIG